MTSYLPGWLLWVIAVPVIVFALITWCCVAMAGRGGSDDE